MEDVMNRMYFSPVPISHQKSEKNNINRSHYGKRKGGIC